MFGGKGAPFPMIESSRFVARDTSCGLLDLSGTRRSACYKNPGEIARNTLGSSRVTRGNPTFFVDDKSRSQAVIAELLVRAELWPFRSRNLKVIHINHCCINWDLDRE